MKTFQIDNEKLTEKSIPFNTLNSIVELSSKSSK